MGWFSNRPSHVTEGVPPDPHVAASWFKRRWVSVDQTLNVWVFNGLPDETISSHAGRRVRNGSPPTWARFVCWLCEWFDKGHCRESIGH
jgi:hypothetical protein